MWQDRIMGVWARAFVLYLALWLILTNAETGALAFGVAVAALAAALSIAGGRSPWPLHLTAWLGFVPWFLGRSLVGGWDVLRRAMRPDRPLDPEWLDFPTRLVTPAAQRFLAATVSLLPGTLVAGFHGGHLRIHVLDRGMPIAADLRWLELHIGALYGERLMP